jgi:hypothetical protein
MRKKRVESSAGMNGRFFFGVGVGMGATVAGAESASAPAAAGASSALARSGVWAPRDDDRELGGA